MTVTYQLSDYNDYRKQSRVVKTSGLSIRSWLTRQNEDSVDPWWKTCHIFTYGSTLTKDTDTLSKRKRNFPDGLARYVIHSAFAVELQFPPVIFIPVFLGSCCWNDGFTTAPMAKTSLPTPQWKSRTPASFPPALAKVWLDCCTRRRRVWTIVTAKCRYFGIIYTEAKSGIDCCSTIFCRYYLKVIPQKKTKIKKEWLNGYGLICAWFLNRPAIHMSLMMEKMCVRNELRLPCHPAFQIWNIVVFVLHCEIAKYIVSPKREL